MPERVQFRRGVKMPEGVRYVGRPSRWGNPFKITRHLTREIAQAAFEDTVKGVWSPTRLRHLPDAELGAAYEGHRKWVATNGTDGWAARLFLGGHDLACYCALDVPWCHGDTLLRIANA